MVKSSIVRNVSGNGTWEGQHGLMYKWEVEFENGDLGTALTKTNPQTTFKVDEEMEYDITSREAGGRVYYNIKAVQKPMGGGGGGFSKKSPETEERIVRMSVLKAATELCAAGKLPLEQVLSQADKFEAWVSKKNP